MSKPILGLTLVGVGGSIIGFGAGYVVAKKRLEAALELRFQQELVSVKDAFDRGQKAGQYGTPESAANALIDPAEQARLLGDSLAGEISEEARKEFEEKYIEPYTSLEGTTDDEGFMLDQKGERVVAGVVNVFEQQPVLVAGYPNPSDENAPYLISVDQFHEEHDEYDKNSIVWYAGDLVLADETEAEIHDIPNTVVPDFADHFGFSSGDPEIVYVRNDRLGIDFEIARDYGLYAEKVMGVTPEPENEVEETFQKIARKRRARDDRDD